MIIASPPLRQLSLSSVSIWVVPFSPEQNSQNRICKNLNMTSKPPAWKYDSFFGAAVPHSAKPIFVRLCLTLRKPLKRLDLNFKILCSCPQAMPVLVIARGHLIFFSLSVMRSVFRHCSIKNLREKSKLNPHLRSRTLGEEMRNREAF